MRTRFGIAVLAAVALAAPVAGQAGDVDVYSNTQLNAANLWRDGTTVPTVPLYEFMSLSGRNFDAGGVAKLSFAVDGWGGLNLTTNPWWNGYDNSGRWSGDLNLFWLRGDFLDDALSVTLGRQTVGNGNSRMLQLDGGSFRATIAKMVTIDGFVGAPTVQRFIGWGSTASSNPTLGDLVVGGRVGFNWRQWVNVGLSTTVAWDHNELTREDVAVDLKVAPLKWMYFLGYMDWSLFARDYYEDFGRQIADANASLVFPVDRFLQFTGEYTYTVPSLFLPYNSILWVFTDATHQYLGGSARLGLEYFKLHVPVDFDVGYRRIFEVWSDIGSSTTAGNKLFMRATWTPEKAASVGAEGAWLDTPENGYWNARLFGSLKRWGFTGTLDLQGYWFNQPVNDFSRSLVAAASLGYDLGNGLAVTGAIQGGQTPFYESFVSGLVKVTYNTSYSFREVR